MQQSPMEVTPTLSRSVNGIPIHADEPFDVTFTGATAEDDWIGVYKMPEDPGPGVPPTELKRWVARLEAESRENCIWQQYTTDDDFSERKQVQAAGTLTITLPNAPAGRYQQPLTRLLPFC